MYRKYTQMSYNQQLSGQLSHILVQINRVILLVLVISIQKYITTTNILEFTKLMNL